MSNKVSTVGLLQKLSGIFLFNVQLVSIAGLLQGYCPFSRAVVHIFDSVGALVLDVFMREPKEVVSHVLMAIWGIWKNRTNWIWNQKKSPTVEIIN